MTHPRILNKHRDVIPPNAKYIGRGSPYGNRCRIGVHGDRAECVRRYECEQLPDIDVEPLRGYDVWCYCAPALCHGNPIFKKLYG